MRRRPSMTPRTRSVMSTHAGIASHVRATFGLGRQGAVRGVRRPRTSASPEGCSADGQVCTADGRRYDCDCTKYSLLRKCSSNAGLHACACPLTPGNHGPGILPEFTQERCANPGDPLQGRLATVDEMHTDEASRILWDADRSKNRHHRKQWEFIFIVRALLAAGVLGPGRRGLVFAAGREPLISYFASRGAHITATDMDPGRAVTAGWATTNQHSKTLDDLYRPHLLSREDFEQRVRFSVADMNELNTSWYGKYDFVWSTCSLEHVGSIALGKLFALKSMNLLKPGGVAIHTTEFTLSSNEDTLSSGSTVLWRRKDVEELVQDLKGFGFATRGVCFSSGRHPADQQIDVPIHGKYNATNHMKLQLANHIITSVGWVARRPVPWMDVRERDRAIPAAVQ